MTRINHRIGRGGSALLCGPNPVFNACRRVLYEVAGRAAEFYPRRHSGCVDHYHVIAGLSNLDNPLFVNPPGQSGLPFTEHFSDQTKVWMAGEYHGMPFSSSAVENNAIESLTLLPGTKTVGQNYEV